jgi:isoleucyl-tRNA synthetase
MFKKIEDHSFAHREEEVLKFWKESNIFKKSVEARDPSNSFTFYDGPPFATGLPHYGHLLAGTIKDVVPRYKTMKGFYVPRRFGWDCHGLPVENEIEKGHNLSGATSIEAFGVANFNEACRDIVLRFTSEWEHVVTRMGRWVDFGNTYRTMDMPFMESVWWVFKRLYDLGLVYEGFKVMPFSAKLGTPLSNFEAGENYKDVDDPSITLAFPLLNEEKTSLLVWTTTPWTLISNLAATVGEDIDYVKIRDTKEDKFYILAKARLGVNFKNPDDYEVVAEFKGKSLVGKKYTPPFNYFSSHAEKGAFRVISDPSVSIEDGTGIVHTAPAFGEADFYACQRAGIEIVCPVDNNGRFSEEIAEFEGKFVKDCDKEIIKKLKESGRLIHQATIRHRYPFCPRSETPLIYKAVSSWFVSVEKIKDRMLKANEKIHWMPEHLKQGRFGKWLEGARDWAISRNRYWGTPIPLWRSEDGELMAIGSIQELESLTGAKIVDLHRHFIDDLTFKKNGKTFRRVTEVFDCWFESGSMPYAQNHYPFENKELFEKNFPADFIAEGLDQTRGWFYTLTVLAAALFDQPAFRNVVVNGIILAEDGQKMSKRLRNYPDPMEVVHKYGADAIRLYMLNSPAVRAQDLRFAEREVELVLRQVMLPWWNAYSFLVTYARIYHWTPQEGNHRPEAAIDRWILSMLHRLIHRVEEGMDDYNLNKAVEPFVDFVDQITNWYIRRSRRRFWNEEDSKDRREAFQTLYTVLLELSKIAAPFVPFIAEEIYQNLRMDSMPQSVHLCDFPQYDPSYRDLALETQTALVETVVGLGHGLRKENKIKVRQPLSAVHITSGDPSALETLKSQLHLIEDELNVKKVYLEPNEGEFVKLTAKPNFKTLGKKLGKMMKEAQSAIGNFSQEQLSQIFNGNTVEMVLGGERFELNSADVEVHREVKEGMIAANVGPVTVVLETALDEALIVEGMAREIVNKINTQRREEGLDVSDRISIRMHTTPRVRECFEEWRDYICDEVLAVDVTFGSCAGKQWDLNGEEARIELSVRAHGPSSHQ